MKIFVSYTIRDGILNSEILNMINENLCNKYDIFIDLLHNNFNNDLWQDKVIEEIKSSDNLILIDTPGATLSPWVRLELETAKNDGISIRKFSIQQLLDRDFIFTSN